MSTTTEKISNDHILITKDCGCKLHVFLTDQYYEPCEKHKKQDEIVSAFRNGAWVEVFHCTPNGFQRVYDEKDLLEAFESNRGVRVLDPMNLNKVIMRY